MQLNSALMQIVQSWRETIINTNTMIWDGSDQSIAGLNSIIADGGMLEFSIDKDFNRGEMEKNFRRAIYAKAIPVAWALNPGKVHPVIIRVRLFCCTSMSSGMLTK